MTIVKLLAYSEIEQHYAKHTKTCDIHMLMRVFLFFDVFGPQFSGLTFSVNSHNSIFICLFLEFYES